MNELNKKFGLNLKYLCTFYGGSHLYGFNTPKSDIDYRGVFINTTPNLVLGLDRFDSTDKVSNDVDYEFYEVRHFMRMLMRGNSQCFECLFAPDSAFLFMDPRFQELVRGNRRYLLDSKQFEQSLTGYAGHEKKLASGERQGKPGGKRYNSIAEFGYSPKNFVQLFRLLYAGTEFFLKDTFPVNIGDYNPELAAELLDIKTNPTKYKKEELLEKAEEKEKVLAEAYQNRVKTYKFNRELANAILVELYMGELGYDLPRGASSAYEEIKAGL